MVDTAPVFHVTDPLTDEVVSAAQALVGSEIRTEGWNQQASRDAIRHYAWGLGDDNPLFSNLAYARSTRHATIVAPPTFLYTICDAAISPGLPGIQPIYGGADWEFFRPVRLDEILTSRAVLAEVKEVRGGRRAPRLLIQRGDVTYFGEDGQPVGHVLSDTLRIPRASVDEGLSYAARGEHQYSPDELARVEDAVRQEVRRGSDTRFWDDVVVGETLAPVVKGPINQFTMTTYYAGCIGSPGYKGAELAWKYRWRAHEAPETLPNQYDPGYFAEYVSPSMGHQSQSIAHEIGMPGAYNNGPQRMGWAAHLLTNWCGDDGWLSRLKLTLREAEIFGDTIWFHGRVKGRQELSPGLGTVDVDIWSVNQLEQETSRGTATIQLPRREAPPAGR